MNSNRIHTLHVTYLPHFIGGLHSRKDGAEAGDYVQTQFAQHGDVGTEVLKPLVDYTPPVYAGSTLMIHPHTFR